MDRPPKRAPNSAIKPRAFTLSTPARRPLRSAIPLCIEKPAIRLPGFALPPPTFSLSTLARRVPRSYQYAGINTPARRPSRLPCGDDDPFAEVMEPHAAETASEKSKSDIRAGSEDDKDGEMIQLLSSKADVGSDASDTEMGNAIADDEVAFPTLLFFGSSLTMFVVSSRRSGHNTMMAKPLSDKVVMGSDASRKCDYQL